MAGHKQGDDRSYWLDKPRNVTRLVWSLYVVCGLLLAIDVFVPKHGPFAIEHAFGFYGRVWLHRLRGAGARRQATAQGPHAAGGLL